MVLGELLYQDDGSYGKIGVVLIFGAIMGIICPLLLKSLSQKKPLPAAKANNKNRKMGHWVPENFKTPKPVAYPDWDIKTTKPLPYRAFKHVYGITMGIRSMKWDEWIELDNEWPTFHAQKLERIEKKGKDVYVTSPEAYPAAMELLSEFREYLPARYPKLFKKTKQGIDILETGEKLRTTEPMLEDPMLVAAKLTQDDLAVMIEGEDGNYYLKAGAIMLAGFWRLKDKVNLPLSAIHTTGDVPKYDQKLKPGMEKFFIRQTCDKPVVRNNYFIQTDDKLAWSSSIGDENKGNVGWYTAPKATDVNQIYFRSERQSVRRLPLSGAAVFTIRTYFVPMVEMCKEDYIPRRLYNGIVSWTDDVKEYRGYDKFADVLLPYLDEEAKKQEARGLTVESEPVSYPY